MAPRRDLSLLAVCLLCLNGKSSGGETELALARFEQSQAHMGTTFRVTFYAPSTPVASAAAQAAFARIAELDAMMSDYDDNSEISRLSRSAGGPPINVSDELFAIIEQSVHFSRQTDGAFDITVGPAVRLWRRARRQRKLPTPPQLARMLERVGSDKLVLDRCRKTVQLTTPYMLLDLGGIAKGYACDQALAVLHRHGIRQALIDGGGDVVLGTPPPGKKGWKIAISSPTRENGKRAQSLLLHGCSVATSGDTARYVELGGKHYSHIVDPKTGIGLTSRLQVTVIAPDGTTADALASAVSVLGPEKGLALIDRIPKTAALVAQATESGIQWFRSRRWDKMLEVSKKE